jgi:flavin-dependent dehydrogenase
MAPASDVAVVGAGPAGSISALLLARAGARVALIDRGLPRPAMGEGVPPSARPLFERLGIDIGGPHLRSPGTVSCWGSDVPTEISFVMSPFGAGWHLDRARFDGQLQALAVEAGATVTRSTPRAAVVLDATGRASSVARAEGARVERVDRLVSVVGVLAARHGDADARTFVSATRDGWWFSSLLPDGRRVAGFQTDRDLLDPDPAQWARDLRAVPGLGELAAERPLMTPPRVVAADSRRLCWQGDHSRLFAVGDADMAFDPLSSLGIMAATSSAEEVVPVVLAMVSGDPAALRPAIRQRAEIREARWDRYRADLAAHYRAESRWPDAPFWRRRHRS